MYRDPIGSNNMAACFCLASLLDSEEQEEQNHLKGCVMVMADPLDLGLGKNATPPCLVNLM